MKKKAKLFAIISAIIFAVIFILVFSCAIVSFCVYIKMVPDEFSADMLKNSTWSTEDGSIKFSIGEEKLIVDDPRYGPITYCASGVAKIDGVEYEFFIADYLYYGSEVVFVSMDVVRYYEQGGVEDYLDIQAKHNLIQAMGRFGINYFTCTVNSGDSILPAGTKLKFYRVD